jgi:spermidine synthase
VVAIARAQFALPREVQVEIGDGAEALSPQCCDVLVIDAYHDELHVPRLASVEFYDAAWLALAEPGVMVVNYMDDDPKLDTYLRRLERAFGGAVLAMHALYDPNVIAFACKGIEEAISWQTLRLRAEKLEASCGLPFTRYVSKLRHMNRCTPQDLLLRAA